MTIPVILVDANVLFTFALRDTILMAAEHDVCRVRWSDRILAETRENLVQNGIMEDEQAANLIRVMHAAFPDALVAGYEPFIARMTNHSSDRHVAAAALQAKADAIVTFNLRHFRSEALAPHGLHAISPDAFLLDCRDKSPETMVAITKQQAAQRRKPPRTASEILTGLARLAPRYSMAMQRYFEPES